MNVLAMRGRERNTKDVTLMRVLKDQAVKHPEKVAVKCAGVEYTYEQVERLTTAFAAYLREEGVSRETMVGVYVDRSERMILTILSILKAGAAYVPLDPTHPSERNRYIVEQSKLAYVVTQECYKGDVSGERKIICLEQIWNMLESKEEEDLSDTWLTGGHQLAYVIFTSGSTGKPKGVQVEHEGMMNYLLSVSDNLGLDENERGLSVVTITFDISISEMFLPLINGGTLVVADNRTAKDGVLLTRLMEEENINLCGFTPSTAYMLLDAGWEKLDGMKLLIGGEPWNMELAGKLLDYGCSQLWNVYGPTETTIYSSMAKIQRNDECVTLGYPIDQTDLYVLDSDMKPVGFGEEGELYIGGIGVARGYYDNEILTKERFIENPFDVELGRIYNTGDIVKLVDESTLVYVGRRDFQVKVRGYRIELGEIEVALAKHDKVAQAVVVVSGSENEAKLCAYVKQKPGDLLTAAELKEHTEKLIPYYMVPNLYAFVEEYPMTPNCKVDRKALMELPIQNTEAGSNFVAPRNEIEEEIAGMWEALLEVSPIGVLDDFLELGGHSLLANRLVIRINKAFGTTITLVDLLSNKMTVEEMAILVEDNLISNLSEEELELLMKEA